MGKFKIISSDYDKHIGSKGPCSTVALLTDRGVFVGTSNLNMETDADYESIFTGGTVAEYRAIKKYWKDVLTEKKSQLKQLEYVYNDIAGCKGFNKQSVEARHLRKNIFILKRDIKEIQKMIDNTDVLANKYVDLKIERANKRMDKKN